MAQEKVSQQTSDSAGTSSGPDGTQDRKVSFQEFIYLMSSQALIQLGSVPNPLTGKTEINLPLAQHSIEILAMIEEKTRGNLKEDEKKVLASSLYDLRMRYVQAVQNQQEGG